MKDLINSKYWVHKKDKDKKWVDKRGTRTIIDQIKNRNSYHYVVDKGLETYLPVIRKFLNFINKSPRYFNGINKLKEKILAEKVWEYFEKEIPIIRKWRTRKTYLCAIRWLLVKFYDCSKIKDANKKSLKED